MPFYGYNFLIVCRLRSSRILVCGLTGVAAEVCKNIVLAGVKSLTVLDPNPFDEMELGARFLISHGEESKPVSIHFISIDVDEYTGTSLLITLWDLNYALNTEVSSIQRSFNTMNYYIGTQNGVLITEVSTFQRFVIEWSHCIDD